MTNNIELSAIVVYYEKYYFDDVTELFEAYRNGLDKTNLEYELIFVIDGELPEVIDKLTELSKDYDNIKIIKLGRWFGDATALEAGFDNASGEFIITLPSYQQVDANDIPKLIDGLKDKDMTIGWRYPRLDGFLNNIQQKFFNFLIKLFVGTHFHDLKCNVRAFRRDVLNHIYMYGDQDRFLPLWAWRYGYKVEEIKVKQFKKDFRQAFYPLRNYISRLLELISLFFLIKFTKKPIRFFGSSGLIVFSLGALLGIYLFIQRVFMGVPLADRPLVLVSILLLVFGVLSFSIGLIGELIIFTHAKDLKDYVIEKVIQFKKNKAS